MFTGIIEAVGILKTIEKKGVSGKINIDAAIDLASVSLGDSIAVSGACLTVVGITKTGFYADISEETLNLTTLGRIPSGGFVNIERALTLSKPLGGHLVTGHIDGTGVIAKVARKDAYIDITVSCPQGLMEQVVKKGSVAVDGISLTVADIQTDSFTVAVIPHTVAMTTLKTASAGTKVNIETDIIGKYVQRFLAKGERQGITEGFLSEHGFVKRG
ncbi:MAG: riboflavin synthase subunit alpha [Deltaproteobacteria bacterium RIFCSPLOWO2_02_FULL_53_8]|nr:MAG: riboflavin synthase subunit alpha [Deltaproteobacteria bacterium RIFCSPLOWO2_02_FULL_53_8]